MVIVRLLRFPTNSDQRFIGGSSGGIEAIENFERQFLRVLNKVYQHIERNEVRLADQDHKDAIKIEWQQVALVIDR